MAGRVHGDREAVEREIDRLFELPPEEFVKERDAAAKRLRAAGDTEGASALSRLRRPTVAAWAIDQLSRRNPDAVGELVALGERLQRAQRRALSGVGADELRELGAQRRRIVERLAQEADRALLEAGRPVSPAVHQAITGTLEAAAVSPQDASALQQGRLERDLAPQSGFDAVDGFTVVEPPKATARGRAKKPRDAPASDRRRVEAARERVREMSEQADRRRREESDAGDAFGAAEHDVDAASSRVEELERALREARNELDAARHRSRAARRGLDDARRAGVRAEQALDGARAALERLDAD
ncbi:MAG: hypothetical protein JOZ99_06310 [Actinobacteria bacterium]|nr:hypothetical protein [Actinomycetota bacterium]